jgi:ribonuclease-3
MEVGERLFRSRLELHQPGSRDFKSRVQEIVQARGQRSPQYFLLRSEGPDHERVFHVELRVGDAALGQGEGRSKVEAEQAAARQALDALSEDES